jgi:hypothetical protein
MSVPAAENYFQYFSEIEEHFQRRRGTLLLLSTLDWALIESWKEQGIPLQAVLRGIDAAFESHEKRPRQGRKINSLAYCTQAVLEACEEQSEASLGAARTSQPALDADELRAYFGRNAQALEKGADEDSALAPALHGAAASLREMETALGSVEMASLEAMEQRLTVLEEKIFAALVAAAPEAEMVRIRTEAERAIAPYRSKMDAAQIAQLHKQFLHKRLLEEHALPRLSLFYMK